MYSIPLLKPADWDGQYVLFCRHCIGHGRKRYAMYCNVLKTMPDGRLKIRVFGERDWGYCLDKSYIRYVDARRVQPYVD